MMGKALIMRDVSRWGRPIILLSRESNLVEVELNGVMSSLGEALWPKCERTSSRRDSFERSRHYPLLTEAAYLLKRRMSWIALVSRCLDELDHLGQA